MKHRVALGAILFLMLFLAACAGDQKVSGTVTSTWQWVSTYKCGKTICVTTHYMFVVNNQTYEDDWDGPTIWVGDHVTFTYGWAGVSDLHDNVKHPYNWTWIIIGVLAVVVVGIGEAVHQHIEDE